MSPEIAKALAAVVAALAAVLASLQGTPSGGDSSTPTSVVAAPPGSSEPAPQEATVPSTESEAGAEPTTTAPSPVTPTARPTQGAPAGGVGRIALSSDGNQHDDDDWAASAMALALLAKGNLQRNVVNYIYNNHIWDSNAEHRKNMTESVTQGGKRFGFDTAAFYDGADATKLAAGVKDLTADINASRPGDELTIVLAGPMETTWMAMNAAKPEARKNVKCVSHGKNSFNQTHGKKDHGGHSYDDVIALGCQRVQIPDQNSELGPTKVSDWAYLNDLGPDMAWLYSRFQPAQKSKGDVSDAGMVYFVLTGKEAPTRSDFKSYLQK